MTLLLLTPPSHTIARSADSILLCGNTCTSCLLTHRQTVQLWFGSRQVQRSPVTLLLPCSCPGPWPAALSLTRIVACRASPLLSWLPCCCPSDTKSHSHPTSYLFLSPRQLSLCRSRRSFPLSLLSSSLHLVSTHLPSCAPSFQQLPLPARLCTALRH